MKITGYAALKPKAKLQPLQYQTPRLKPWDVLIEVTHCGICHSDIHLINNDWDFSIYPIVPGHEIVGHVAETGSNVLHLKKGERVGVGWQAGSCMDCEWCKAGSENFCSGSQAVCNGNHGGFGEMVVCDSRFAFPIPKKLSSETVAPLLCGGITVYSPLKNHAKRKMKVGIIGIGGLGHFALQFANAFGCEVTAFSSTPGKATEAKELGAHHFVVTKRKNLERLSSSFDFLLSTVNVNLDWKLYLELLRPKGKLCIVGVPPSELKIHPFSLILGDKSLCGSVIGNRRAIREMLEFSARHGIKAKTELMPIHKVNEAIARVKANKARYRIVLEH